jgi:hypothetical protein
LSIDNQNRHRGSDEPDAPSLGELEPGTGGEGDVVIGGKQGDQGDHDAGEDLESALEIQAATTDAETAEERTAAKGAASTRRGRCGL